MKNEIVQVSFKGTNQSDIELFLWLQTKFEEYGGKSAYFKYLAKKEMKEEKTATDSYSLK